MSKRKNHWYVIVLTRKGAVFVTGVQMSGKTAVWDDLKQPLEFDEWTAKDIALGLTLNMTTAYTVCSPIEIEVQPYLYNEGEFQWVWNHPSEYEQ